MPNAANITVKKSDGTTDVVYTLLAQSGGDKSPALWGNQTVGTSPAQKPKLSVKSEDTGTGTARRLILSYKWPKSVTAPDGSVTVKGGIVATLTWTIPQDAVQGDIDEATAQGSNLFAAPLIKDSLKVGFAPT